MLGIIFALRTSCALIINSASAQSVSRIDEQLYWKFCNWWLHFDLLWCFVFLLAHHKVAKVVQPVGRNLRSAVDDAAAAASGNNAELIHEDHHDHDHGTELHSWIGVALVLGFVFMLLVDQIGGSIHSRAGGGCLISFLDKTGLGFVTQWKVFLAEALGEKSVLTGKNLKIPLVKSLKCCKSAAKFIQK